MSIACLRAPSSRAVLAVLLALLPALAGCSSMYYSALESFGIEKRELLADRVEDGRDAQQEAGEQFRTTLEAFKAVTGFQGGKLEGTYARLDKEFQRCASAAAKVSERIEAIETVAADLFEEWEAEIGQIRSADLRASSHKLLGATRDRYEDLIGAMRRAESRMPPVLGAFHDQVLFLKHNLNAQAIVSLQDDVAGIEQDVTRLLSEMEASIAEADAFIQSLG